MRRGAFSTGCFRMLLQVRFYKWAYRNNLELIEMSEVQRSANQLASQPASTRCSRYLSVDQRDAVLCAAVLQHRFLVPQRYFKLALGFIVRNGIAIHKTGCSAFSRFYATAAPQQQVVPGPLFESVRGPHVLNGWIRSL